MESDKHSMFFGMIEEKFGTRLPRFRLLNKNDSEEDIGRGLTSNKQKSVLSTIKKMVKFEHPSSGYPTSGSGFIRKWKSSYHGGNSSGSKSEYDDSLGAEKKVGWWEPPQDSLPVEFCQDTSLHGLKYIGQSKRHPSERIFWFLTFTVGLSVAIWLISEMWTKYKNNPIIVSFQNFETNIDEIPYPAVTICNMNKVMKSKAQEYIRGAKEGNNQSMKDVFYLNHVCSSTQSFSRRFNYTQNDGFADAEKEYYMINNTVDTNNLTRVIQFLRKAAQNCTEMIRHCVWHDEEIDCKAIFKPIETQFGKCCTFNFAPLSLLFTKRNISQDDPKEIKEWEQWDIDKDGLLLSTTKGGPQFPRRQMKAGLTNGLSLLLNVDSAEYYCTSSDSVGFRMATHLPLELPKIADFGISLRTESETFVDVLPQITMVDEDVFSFPLNKRNCYRTAEYKLNHYKYYSVNNCVDECIASETIKVCKCKRYYMPRDVNETLCGPNLFECAEQVKFNLTKDGIRNTCSMCYQSCTEVNYELQTTSTPLKKGIWNFDNGTVPNWNESDLSIVHVYIGQDSFYAKVRKELYGPTDLFANTGGLMGLCLGFSGLSVVEILYFLTLRAWWKSRRKQTVVPEHEQQMWARKSNTPISATFTGFEKKASDTNIKVESKESNYYRSIFGEIRQNR